MRLTPRLPGHAGRRTPAQAARARRAPDLHGLGPRLVALIALAALLAGGLVGLVAARSSRDALRAAIMANNLATADLAAEFVAQYVQAAQRAVRLEAENDALIRDVLDDAPERVQPRLAQVLAETPQLSHLAVVDTTGTIRVGGAPVTQTLGGSVADRAWFQAVVATGQPQLGAPSLSRLSARPIVPYVVPIQDEAAAVRGMLVGGVSLDALSAAVNRIQPGASARTGLHDVEHQVILAHADPARILDPITWRNAAAARAAAGESGAAELPNSSGELQLAAYASVPGLPWAILVQQPSGVAFAPVAVLSRQILLMMCAAILVAAALGAVMAVQILRPLRQLRTAAQAIAAGALDTRVAVRGHCELGELSSAFSHMAAQVQRDAAEREAAAEALQTSEKRFRQLADAVDEVFWLTSLDKTQVLYVSPAYEAIWGRSRESLYAAPRSWLAAIHPDDRARVLAAYQGPEDGSYREEYRIVRPDGEVRWITDRAFPVRDASGAIYRIAGVATDVTERKRIGEELRRAERDKHRLEGITLAAREMAHLLNNALATPVGAIDLLREQATIPAHLRVLIDEAAASLADAQQRILQFQRVVRIETKETVVGPSLDLERSVQPETSGEESLKAAS